MSQSFDALCEFLRRNSGLIMEQSKRYLVESRVMPIVRREKLSGLDELVMLLQRGQSPKLAKDVIEAMTINETYFFRDKTPFDQFRSVNSAEPSRGPLRREAPAHLVGRRFDRSGSLLACHDHRGHRRQGRRLEDRDRGHRPLRGRARQGEKGHLLAVRGPERSADDLSSPSLQPDRRFLADQRRHALEGHLPLTSICCRITPPSAASTSSTAATC